MTKKQTDKLMNVLIGLASFAVLLGALLKLQHHPNGNLILYTGFIISGMLSGIEINRLKKRIKVLEKDSPKF